MKVKQLIEILSKLPQTNEIHFERDTNYGRVEYDFSHAETKSEVRPKYDMTMQIGDGEVYDIQGIEEMSERCIMVLS